MLTGWLKTISQLHSFAWWCARDPMPFLRAFLEMLGAAWRRSKSLLVPGRSPGLAGLAEEQRKSTSR